MELTFYKYLGLEYEMKDINLKIAVVILFGSIFLAHADFAWAQAPANTYGCAWHADKNLCSAFSKCETGFTINTENTRKCNQLDITKCTVTFNCIKKTEVANPTTNKDCSNAKTDLDRIECEGLPGFNFAGATLGEIVQKALPWVFGLAGIGLLLYLIYGGFHLMISGGEPKVVQEAKGKITNALVGFVIVFIAYWIVQLIGRIFGLEGITSIFG